MKLSEFIDWLKSNVASMANDDPEIKFSASYEDDDGSITVAINFIK